MVLACVNADAAVAAGLAPTAPVTVKERRRTVADPMRRRI
jgi:hypothetical protein